MSADSHAHTGNAGTMKQVRLRLLSVLRMTRRQRAGGAFILLLHAALFSFGPPPVVFLANHDHVVVGAVTADQWRAHVEAHLRQAGSHYVSSGLPHAPLPTDQPRITSLPGCGYDALGVPVRALAVALLLMPYGVSVLALVGQIDAPFVVDRSPDLLLSPPPPRPYLSAPTMERAILSDTCTACHVSTPADCAYLCCELFDTLKSELP